MSATELRRLNDQGIRAFREFLEDTAAGDRRPAPEHILKDAEFSDEIDFALYIEKPLFESRYEMGKYLIKCLEDIDVQLYFGDVGFWSWIALYWIDILCPPDANGKRKPSKPYNYILSTNYNHQPRHAVRTSYFLVRKYDEHAKFLLSNPPDKRGDLIEQLAARQFLIECRGVVEAASKLYYDPVRGTSKRGATSTKRKGNVRRYVRYLQQLQVNYDLYSIEANDLLGLLPAEFEKFQVRHEEVMA